MNSNVSTNRDQEKKKAQNFALNASELNIQISILTCQL